MLGLHPQLLLSMHGLLVARLSVISVYLALLLPAVILTLLFQCQICLLL